jgi:hypothetical protein
LFASNSDIPFDQPKINSMNHQKTQIHYSRRMLGAVLANRKIVVCVGISILKVIMKRNSTKMLSIFFCLTVCLASATSNVFAQTNGAPKITDPLPPHLQRLEDISNGLGLQWKKQLEELEPRCPHAVREQASELEAYMRKCDRPKNIQFSFEYHERRLKTCVIPTIQSALESSEKLGKSAVCAPLPSAKNCRGEQCPLPPALIAEFKRNDDLMAELLTDAMQVCPKAYAETKRMYDYRAIQCQQENSGNRTAQLRCDIAIRIKLMPELKNKTKNFCNTYLQP